MFLKKLLYQCYVKVIQARNCLGADLTGIRPAKIPANVCYEQGMREEAGPKDI